MRKLPLFMLSAVLAGQAVSACDSSTVFEMYGTCLYLQPGGTDQYYGVQAIGLDPDITIPALSPNWDILEINPRYHWGFEIGTKVTLPCSGFSLDANWERLHCRDSSSFLASSADGFMVGPFFDIGPNSEPYKLAQGTVKHQFDKVDLRLGKAFCFNDNFIVNFFAGVSGARINHTLQSSYSNASSEIARTLNCPSTFMGAGPMIGLAYDYEIFCNFFFVGETTSSLLVGRSKNQTTFQSLSPELTTLGIPQPNTQATYNPHRAQMVPGLEQRIGFSYMYSFDCWSITLEAGYQCQLYFNAIQSVDMTAPQVLPAGAIFTPQVGLFAVGFERTISDFMLNGIYATLNIEF